MSWHLATSDWGHFGAVEYFCSEVGVVVAPCSHDGWTVQLGTVGVAVAPQSHDGWTPFHLAAWEGHLGGVEPLSLLNTFVARTKPM